jgi:hypothetical protein
VLQLLIIAIAVLAIAIVTLGYLWIVHPRRRSAPPPGATFFESPHTHPWGSAAERGRGTR